MVKLAWLTKRLNRLIFSPIQKINLHVKVNGEITMANQVFNVNVLFNVEINLHVYVVSFGNETSGKESVARLSQCCPFAGNWSKNSVLDHTSPSCHTSPVIIRTYFFRA